MRNRTPTTRLYEIKPGSYGWARIWVTDDGCISIMSDYGNYGYWFGSPEMEFRSFLLQCDDSYLGRKFAGGAEELDGEQTLQNVKVRILSLRHEMNLSREDARKEWAMLPRIAFDDRDEFVHWLHQTSLKEAWELSSYCLPSRVRHFLKNVWPLFTEKLRHDLASEDAA